MSKVVWRFPLTPNEAQDEDVTQDEDVRKGWACDVEIPAGAEILGVKNSSRGLILHAIVEPEAETETRSVCGNNVELPEGAGAATYRGTYKRAGGTTAHVFEVVKVAA